MSEVVGAFGGRQVVGGDRRQRSTGSGLSGRVARLLRGGFTLLDTQFVTPHLATFGAVEITRAAYRRQLAQALEVSARFYRELDPEGEAVLGSLLTSRQE